MELNNILSVSGKPGLFKLVSKTKTGLVAESLLDQKKLTIFAHEKVSSLDEISIFTTGEDLPLKDVFKKIEAFIQAGNAVNMQVKPEELRNVFSLIVPEFDQEKVYNSDIKKILSWFLQLKELNLLDFSEEVSGEEKNENEQKANEGESTAEPAEKP